MIKHARTSSVTPVLPLTAERDAVPLALLVHGERELSPVERVLVWRRRIFAREGSEAVQCAMERERDGVYVWKPSVRAQARPVVRMLFVRRQRRQ